MHRFSCKLYIWLIACLFIVPFQHFSANADTNLSSSSDTLPYPVFLILSDQGNYGSGFYLQTETAVFLVTARHVIFNAPQGTILGNNMICTSSSADPVNTKEKFRLELDLSILERSKSIRHHSHHDIAVIKIGGVDNGRLTLLDGVKRIDSTKGEPSRILWTAIRPGGVLRAGQAAVLSGYPTSRRISEAEGVPITLIPEPRTGALVEINQEKRELTVDTPMYKGDSGSPLFQLENLNGEQTIILVGIAIQTREEVEILPTGEKIMTSLRAIAVFAEVVMETVGTME